MSSDDTAAQRGRSPLLIVLLVVGAVLGIVLLLRRGADTSPDATPRPASSTVPAPTPAAVVDLPTARRQVSLFIVEADLVHSAVLVDAAKLLAKALANDDCISARAPYDRLKEEKVDLTTHTALVLSQIRMLTSVGAYCNTWAVEHEKSW